MRFMIIRKADPQTEAGAKPSRALLDAMMAYNEEMVRAGVMLAGDGLKPSARRCADEVSRGKPTVMDGPFAESKELVAGYSIIQVGSREEALEWLESWPVEDGDGEVELELRELYEAEDFGDDATPLIQRQERLLRERPR